MPKLTALPLAAEIDIMPQPTPTQYGIAKINNGGQTVVVLQVATSQGVQFFFMSQDVAKQVARDLENAGGGIVIVPAGVMPGQR